MDQSTSILFTHGDVILNKEQFQIVTAPSTQNQRILAGAGSGKTTTITARIAYLIERQKIPANKIILLTFSRAAAEEMQHRVARLVGNTDIIAGTFHAVASRVLRDNAASAVADQPFVDEYPLRFLNWLKTEEGAKWASRFKVVIIDEVQDINQIQWDIIQSIYLSSISCCLTVVGDDAQNIYTWRGSSVDFLFNFHNHIANTKDYQLRINYRSSESIVRIANSVMRFIPTLPFKERMIAGKKNVGSISASGSSIAQSHLPSVHFFYRSQDEYDWIVKDIAKHYSKNTKETFAILARNNSSLYKIEERLHQLGLMYNIYTKYNPDRSQTHFRRITLATIHASKGLEWDHVYLMNCSDDCLPSRKTDEDIIAERRLFYVAITRARSYLTITYSRNEPSLSRFVREIPRPFLIYHGISLYKLSVKEQGQSALSLSEKVGSMDGYEWQILRDQGAVPLYSTTKTKQQTETLFTFGQFFQVPKWVKDTDCRETWHDLVTWIIKREIALQTDEMMQLMTTDILETLLTIRIYGEDLEFWNVHESEMLRLVHHFLKYKGEPTLAAVEFADLQQYVAIAPLGSAFHSWTQKDIVAATIILAKIRGQLRPLRHDGYDLADFTFGFTRSSVPTEYRPFVLKSWKSVLNSTNPTHTIIGDLWNVAALRQVREGRNIPLYQLKDISKFLASEMMLEFIDAVHNGIKRMTANNPGVRILNMLVESVAKTILPIQIDCVTSAISEQDSKVSIFKILTRQEPLDNAGPSQEDFVITALHARALAESTGHEIQQLEFFNSSTGMLIKLPWTDELHIQTNIFWNHLKCID